MGWFRNLFSKSKWSASPLCGHWAYLAADVAQVAGLYSEVCTGPHIDTGRPHAQARAIIEGKMEWIGPEFF